MLRRHPRGKGRQRAGLAIALCFALPAHAGDEPATVAPTVTVIGQTPLPGLELPLGQIAAPA